MPSSRIYNLGVITIDVIKRRVRNEIDCCTDQVDVIGTKRIRWNCNSCTSTDFLHPIGCLLVENCKRTAHPLLCDDYHLQIWCGNYKLIGSKIESVAKRLWRNRPG